jgi:hypothetical protein
MVGRVKNVRSLPTALACRLYYSITFPILLNLKTRQMYRAMILRPRSSIALPAYPPRWQYSHTKASADAFVAKS